MKNLIIIFSFFISMAAVSCGSSSSEHSHADTASKTGTKTAKKYTCPMHSEEVADKPGACPKCKMELVEKS